MTQFIPFSLPLDTDDNSEKVIIDDLIFEEKDNLYVYENIWTYENTVELDKFVKDKYLCYLNEVKNVINEYNNTKHTLKSVELLLGDVLISSMTTLFFKKIILQKLKKYYIELEVLVFNTNYIPEEVSDVFYNFSSNDFHSIQYEELANHLNINVKKVTSGNQLKPTKIKRNIKDKLYEAIIKTLLKFKFCKSIVFAHNINENIYSHIFTLPFKTLFGTFYFPKNELINIGITDKIDIMARNNLLEKYREKDIILGIILKNLPTGTLEGLKERKKSILALFGKEREFSIYTGVGIYTSSFLKYLCFFYEDVKLNIFQHGGLYGMCENHHQGYFYENKVSDNFFKWGKYFNEKNILSASQINRKYRYCKNILKSIDFLFVLSTGHKQFSSTGYYSSPLRKINLVCMLELYEFVYLEYSNTFLRTLNCCNEHDYINTNYKNIKLDKNKQFNDSLMSTNIIVTDHFGTTYLEALASNVPIIVILNRENQAVIYTDEFEKLISEMKINTILFDSVEEFKEYFKNKEQILSNWFTNEVSILKDKICNNYLIKDGYYVNTLVELLKKDK